jgi:SnoaL-like protein
MNDEDAIRNLQNAYGYYMDRKMWDDVTDLFTARRRAVDRQRRRLRRSQASAVRSSAAARPG